MASTGTAIVSSFAVRELKVLADSAEHSIVPRSAARPNLNF